jgi:hypothetical protein
MLNSSLDIIRIYTHIIIEMTNEILEGTYHYTKERSHREAAPKLRRYILFKLPPIQEASSNHPYTHRPLHNKLP